MGNTLNAEHHHAGPPQARRTIGVLFENMPNEQQDYLAEVLAGINSVAHECDLNLLYFTGGHLYHTFYNEFDTQRNILYELVTERTVNGLIMLGTIGTYAPVHKTMHFFYRYAPLPTIKVGQPLENIPTVVADEETGAYDAMVHLIRDHHYRRIAFIDYPKDYPYHKPRYYAYTRALTDYGIPIDPDLIIPGEWTVDSGREVMHLLLDQRKVHFDAVVASNDNMALGALEVLQSRHIYVPYDIALVGFDDVKMARLAIPSLTTVRQPVFELGVQAVKMLLAKIAGDEIPPQILLPTELVIRQSCGCPDPLVARTAARSPSASGVLMMPREQMSADLTATLGPSPHAGEWAGQLLNAITADLQDPSAGTFLPTLDKILRQVIEIGGDVALWQNMLTALRSHIQPYLGNAALSDRLEDLWHQARVFIGEMAWKELAQRQLQADQQNILLRLFGEALATTFDMDTLLHIVAARMPQLGIPSCYLALYENPQPYEYPQPAPEWAYLVLAYGETTTPPLIRADKSADDAWRFPSQLLPPGILPQERRYTMVVEPLYFQRDQIGFALLEMGPPEGQLYEIVREQISSALKSALLFHEQKRVEIALGKAYAEVEKQVQERTVELEQEIVERKQAEKMQRTLIAELRDKNAELERFTYTVSHDLKSPLITIAGFVGFLESDIPAGDAARIQADLAHINAAVAKMQQLLNELLKLSRIGRLTNPPEEVPLETIVREALALAEGGIAARGIKVEIAPDLPTVYGDRARLVEVIQNLVDNACKFMGDQPQPHIEIGMRHTEEGPVFYVRDNGIGIEPQYQDKVFGLFEKLDATTEGTGVGLAIVQRIVETHGGRLWVESEGTGHGSTFCFTLASHHESPAERNVEGS